jgi:hypothetical protein
MPDQVKDTMASIELYEAVQKRVLQSIVTLQREDGDVRCSWCVAAEGLKLVFASQMFVNSVEEIFSLEISIIELPRDEAELVSYLEGRFRSEVAAFIAEKVTNDMFRQNASRISMCINKLRS